MAAKILIETTFESLTFWSKKKKKVTMRTTKISRITRRVCILFSILKQAYMLLLKIEKEELDHAYCTPFDVYLFER